MQLLREILEKFYLEYDFQERASHDPIKIPRRYHDPRDAEIAGFIASCFAYGRVELFMPVVDRILSMMGKSPYDFISEFNKKKHSARFHNIRYRFNREEDIVLLIAAISGLIKKHGSIENAFKGFFHDKDADIGAALTGFVDFVLSMNASRSHKQKSSSAGTRKLHSGFAQFFPSPANGSACKRMNLFLRWMIRDRDIDLGLWKGIPKNKLVIPLDTHIARISKCLGFTNRASQNWKTAVEITQALKRLDPEDPLKYDFAMCHHGISGMCASEPRRKKQLCEKCVFRRLTRL